jgi:hypothetical protein
MRAAIVIVVAGFCLAACSHAPNASRYIIDGRTTGWVKVIYNRPDAPPLPVENGYAVVRISQNPLVVTGSPMNPSWEKSEFYYRLPDGKMVMLSSADDKNRLLWGMEKTSDQDGDREVFFVGGEEHFTRAVKIRSSLGASMIRSRPLDPPKEAAPIRLRVETSLTDLLK